MAGSFTLGIGSPTGTTFSLGFGDTPAKRTVAGEPSGIPTKTLLIAGGLAVAAIALVFLLKP